MPFIVYLLFVVSWFTHLTQRIPSLGAIRFDFALVILLTIFYVFKMRENQGEDNNAIGKHLMILIVYAILTVPFVEWPGSVINRGLINFIKAVVFYFFTVQFIRTEKQLKIFLTVFLACQTFRVLEPLYLHVTQGYWGSAASMANWQLMYRLSGAPYDIVNPNGLAFIIVTIFPFLYYYARISKIMLVLSIILLPLAIWALILTASRSGMLAFLMVIVGIIIKSKSRVKLSVVVAICVIFTLPHLTGNEIDRYKSIFSHNTKNAATSEGRIRGLITNFRVALRRPLFGHGLGTSAEVNANFAGRYQPAHNLYAEAAQEIGFIGLFIFLLYIASILKLLKSESIKWRLLSNKGSAFIGATADALLVFFYMNLVFSLASYGLSGYEWYLMPALIVLISTFSTLQVETG